MAKLTTISLGAGVQSTTMALMAAHGEIEPMPDCAIFADTGWEPAAVYSHLAWLIGVLPFPVHIVSGGNLRDDLLLLGGGSRRAGAFTTVPFFLKHPDGKPGMGRRQCTTHYKIEPVRRKVRELLGRPKGPVPAGSVEQWIGISVDEIIRATPSKVQFIVSRFPLLEKQMRRQDCLTWIADHGYPTPPKSACLGCPFHNDHQWRDLRRDPVAWSETVAIDRAIRTPLNMNGDRRNVGEQFMHRQRVPLDQVDLSTAEERGRPNMFLHECEGMCGV